MLELCQNLRRLNNNFVSLSTLLRRYIDQKTTELQKSNRAIKILMICIHCILLCLEKVARFITESAYILIAVEGQGFCMAAWRSFKLLYTNSLRIATTQLIAWIVVMFANLGIALFCTAITVAILKKVDTF